MNIDFEALKYLYSISCNFVLTFQHKLKFSQRDKVKKFITFTQTGEQTAIYCLAQNDWKLDLASDNYFQNPEAYYKESRTSVDKKKLEQLFTRYQGTRMNAFFFEIQRKLIAKFSFQIQVNLIKSQLMELSSFWTTWVSVRRAN